MLPYHSPRASPGMEMAATNYDALEKELESILDDPEAEPVPLPLEYLQSITDYFSNDEEVGRGGFGVVYRGVLRRSGKIIAVKMLSDNLLLQDCRSNKDQFQNEVINLSVIKHQNIVRLVGYCADSRSEVTRLPNGSYVMAETTKTLLCFEYLCNGSLHNCISNETSDLSWETRYEIIEGICRGVHYLHGCSIVHMDLKPQNILMDDDMMPKITDFGLSRLLSEEKSKTLTLNLTGSLGYMAPEYINDGIISPEADIYSMGVIMIEIITGRRNNPRSIPHSRRSNQTNSHPGTEISLQQFTDKEVERWRKIFRTSQNNASLLETYTQQVKQLICIALKCVDNDRNKRPDAWEILQTFNANAANGRPSDSNSKDHPVRELLSVHPLQLQFSLVKPIELSVASCTLHLSNNTGEHIAFRLLTSQTEAVGFLRPPSGIVPPRCKYTVAAIRGYQQKALADSSDEVFTLESTVTRGQGLWNFQRSKFSSGHDHIFRRAREKGREVHQMNLTAVSPHAEVALLASLKPAQVPRTFWDGTDIKSEITILGNGSRCWNNEVSIDVHPTQPWIMATSDSRLSFAIWDYHMQEKVRAYGTKNNKELNQSSTDDDDDSDDYRILISLPAVFIAQKSWIVVGCHSGHIKVYSYMAVKNFKESKTYLFSEIKKFKAHEESVRSLDVHPTGPYVLSASYYEAPSSYTLKIQGGTIKLFDWEKGWDCIWTFDVQCYIKQIKFNPKDANDFVSVSNTDGAKVWNTSPPNCKSTLSGTQSATCFDFFLRGGRLCLIIGHEKQNKATIWDYHDMTCVETLRGQMSPICVCSHPELPMLVTGSYDGTVRLWNSNTFSLVATLNCSMGAVTSVACLRGSRRIVIAHRSGLALAEIDHEEQYESEAN